MDAIASLLTLSKGAARGGKYYKRVSTGNPKRPWRYFYSEAEYRQSMGDGAHLEGVATKDAHEKKKREKALSKMAGTVEAVSAKIADGSLPGPLSFQIRKAKETIRAHESGLEALVGTLQTLSPPNAKIKGRVKKLESALGKVVRKPKYGDAGNLQDATGARIICRSVKEVQDTVSRIKNRYKLVEEDDYINKAKGDYRSHHLIIEDNGQQKEIQVRTGNQDVWADWFHDMYKPLSLKQEQDVKTHKGHLEGYAKQTADFMFAKDQGKQTPPPVWPPCTHIVKNTFGCLEVQ